MHALSAYQQGQLKVISDIEEKIKNNALNFSTVSPVADFENDARMSLTSVHFPDLKLLAKVQKDLISPLREISPEHYYYSNKSLHLTIKNVKIIADPPNFDKLDIENCKQVFEKVISKHKSFNVYFYRLLLFPNNLALIGTTDPQLDNLVLDLDRELKTAGVPDDKQYANEKYFFSNMTLVRFNSVVSREFKNKVIELSKQINFEPYLIDSVDLVETNASLTKCRVLDKWILA